MNRKTRSILPLFLFALALLCSAVNAAETRRVGLLVDELAVAPLRVESSIINDLAGDIVDTASLTLLVPTESGVVDHSGAKVDLNAFDVLWLYQGDSIVQNTALFSDATVAELQAFVQSDPNKGVLLTGGSAALADKLGFPVALTTAVLDFGHDRAQGGLTPVAKDSTVFANVDLDRNVGWVTNAAFYAFANYFIDAPNAKIFATNPPGGYPNPLFIIQDEESDVAKVVAFAWRVSPLYDAAPKRYQDNFVALLTNLLAQTGRPIVPSDLVAPKFALPDFDALNRALDHFAEVYDESEYPKLNEYRNRLAALRALGDDLEKSADSTDDATLLASADALQADFDALQKEALLASPEVDFDEFLFIKRNPNQMGLPDNYGSNSVIPTLGYEDELRRFNLRTDETALVYKPENGEYIGDLELYYDASKVMFSSPDVSASNRWRIWELPLVDGAKPERLPLIGDLDVDNYDACYLPDDRIIFCSTAPMVGVPCINGSGHVCCLYIMERDGSIRQLTVEQDHDWNPVVMNNGRVMYLRWEYVDLPHAFSRIMFHMNPDGTNQSELYGSGSYWPNAIFYARPLPGDSDKFVGIVGGHHEKKRVGDLVIFDPSLGRKEATGAVQRIPGYGKPVEPIACDLPIAQNWPIFLYPFPVSETMFLVSCQRSPNATWEICLVDVYDNISTLVKLDSDAALEPVPLRETERQPLLADRVDLNSKTADVFIADIYEGEGLKGVSRGEVKALRVFSYEFAYQGMGAEPYSVGLDGPWDPRRIIGTVPVNEDGSASFKIPAYAPIALQPLDKEGQALQIMRSWITAMPGETVSCVGCHEPQSSTSSTAPRGLASQMKPVEIQPFYGATRGFSFEREIQPIVNKYCLDCHRPDSERVAALIAEGKVSEKVLEKTVRPRQVFEDSLLPDFSYSEPKPALANPAYIASESPFSNTYFQLRRYVRTLTKESEMPTHRPYEFSAETTSLVDILRAGHYGVELDPESWDKLNTWIDLNAPYNGSWGEILRGNNALVKSQYERREALRDLYAPNAESVDDDPSVPTEVGAEPSSTKRVRFERRFNADLAMGVDSKTAQDEPKNFSVPLAEGVELEMTRVPGANFSVARFEIDNEQYRAFNPNYHSGIEYGDFIQFSPGERGWSLDRPRQPVVRVTWNNAVDFCKWLSEKTGDEYRLPTREEWSYMALAGSSADYWFSGDPDADYALFENLGDLSYTKISPFGWAGRSDTLPEWRPVDFEINDHCRNSAPIGSYEPNPWGIYDAQGNVAEWTSSELVEDRSIVNEDGTVESKTSTLKKIVCGGSWAAPKRYAKRDSLRAYPPQYGLRDVGFRVIRVEKD